MGAQAPQPDGHTLLLSRPEVSDTPRRLGDQLTQSIVRRRAAGGVAAEPPVLATGYYRNMATAMDG